MVTHLKKVNMTKFGRNYALSTRVVIDISGKKSRMTPGSNLHSQGKTIRVENAFLLIRRVRVIKLDIGAAKVKPRAVSAKRLHKLGAGLFGGLYQSIVYVLVVPKTRSIRNIAVVVNRRIYLLRLKSLDNLGSRPDMIAMRMGANVEVKVVGCYANALEIANNLIFVSIAFGDAIPQRVTRVGAIGVGAIFPRINHAKMATALYKNSVRVVKRHNMNFGVTLGSMHLAGRSD